MNDVVIFILPPPQKKEQQFHYLIYKNMSYQSKDEDALYLQMIYERISNDTKKTSFEIEFAEYSATEKKTSWKSPPTLHHHHSHGF